MKPRLRKNNPTHDVKGHKRNESCWTESVEGEQKTRVLTPGDASHQSIESILMSTQSPHYLQTKQTQRVKSQSNQL